MKDRTNASIRRPRPPSLALIPAVLLAVLAAWTPGFTSTPTASSGATSGPPHPTLDPRPPMTLTVEVVSVQKNAAGGVASLLLKVGADVAVEDAVVSVKVPDGLVFTDGSAARTWNIDLTKAGTVALPVDVIVPQDGKYVVTAELTGTARGKAMHRGAASRLLVGVAAAVASVRGGAIEYRAAEAGEPAP